MPTRRFGLRSLVFSEITKSSWKVYIIPILPPKDFSWKTFSTERIIYPIENSDEGRTVGLKQFAFKGIRMSRFRLLPNPERIPSGHFHLNWRILFQKGKSLQFGSHVSGTARKDTNSGGSPWLQESQRGLLISRPAGGCTHCIEHGSAVLCLSPPVLLLEALDERSPDPNKNVC